MILGGIGLALSDSAAGSDRPLNGQLAPLDTSLVIGWTELARLTTEEIIAEKIRALDWSGDSLFVLQPHAWSLVVGGQHQGTYGTALTGAPEYLARAEGIVRTAEGVAVLDAPRHRITMWTPSGERLEDRVLGQPNGQVALHRSLSPTSSRMLLTTWITTDSGGHWLVQRFQDSVVDTLPVLPGLRSGESFNIPYLMAGDSADLTVVDAESWRIRRYSASLTLLDSSRRADAPHFAVPAEMARRMRANIAMIPEPQRRDFLLGESLPSLRGATMTARGELLAITVRDDEATIAELIGRDGRPIASLWSVPDSSGLFAVRGSLLRVRELDAVTIIERLDLRPHD
jgi:hypothetical protein